MQAGKLRHRVTIQQLVGTRDVDGAVVPTWQNVKTVWGAVEPLRGREFVEAAQLQEEITTRVRIRYRSGIVPAMRVLWGGFIYDIRAVVHVETRFREMHLMCVEAK